jgi:DtxR family transcriptional regulator, Mn-dependent transcriptional regulator
MSLSAAMQEYLAETYRLAYYQGDEQHVSTSALAKVLNVSDPAVTRMVQRLRDAGYLVHEPYRGVRLTPAGAAEALKNIRRHRVVERFLTDVMQFGWHEVHEPADALGATVSDVLVERMAVMAGNPRRCPHGEPIPTRDGVMPRVVDYPLTEADERVEWVVSRVNSHEAEVLHYLDSLGLKTGAVFTLAERAPFNGPLRLLIDGKEHHIGHELARVLRVCTPDEFALV